MNFVSSKGWLQDSECTGLYLYNNNIIIYILGSGVVMPMGYWDLDRIHLQESH